LVKIGRIRESIASDIINHLGPRAKTKNYYKEKGNSNFSQKLIL